MNFLKLTEKQLDIAEINALVVHPSCGAVSHFVGTTRENFGEKKVLSLEYEAYKPMAIKVLTKICDQIRERWPDIKHIAMHHRTGLVEVKEASIIIAISSPHRNSSLQSVSFAIEELKKNVPIWKKEKYGDNESIWKENMELKRLAFQGIKKRHILEFDRCPIQASVVSSAFVQIVAEKSEISRRIQCFVDKKREEIDMNNVRDFLPANSKIFTENDVSARTNGIFLNKFEKGHLKVRRVKNYCGPQTRRIVYMKALDKLMEHKSEHDIGMQKETETKSQILPRALIERIECIEGYLNISRKDVNCIFERLKKVENTVLFMESLSPEYHHFLKNKIKKHSLEQRYIQTPSFGINQLDAMIRTVQTKINMKEKI